MKIMPARQELPDTLKRSPKKAQGTWIKTHDSAVEQCSISMTSRNIWT